MADDIDLATETHDRGLARAIAAARVPIPVGVAGTCRQCFDYSPRLVAGRCAPCRDGRR